MDDSEWAGFADGCPFMLSGGVLVVRGSRSITIDDIAASLPHYKDASAFADATAFVFPGVDRGLVFAAAAYYLNHAGEFATYFAKRDEERSAETGRAKERWLSCRQVLGFD